MLGDEYSTDDYFNHIIIGERFIKSVKMQVMNIPLMITLIISLSVNNLLNL